MDETSIEINDGKVTVIVPKDRKKAIQKCSQKFSHHMTLITCVAADASQPPKPAVIFPLENMPPLSDHVTDYFDISGSENGWITTQLWSKWVRETFIPHVEKRRSELFAKGAIDQRQAGRALLYLDSHSSRIDLTALQQLENSGIVCVTIPAHSSHIMQPLDCGVHNLLKSHLRRNRVYLKTDSLPSYRQSLLYLLRGAYDVATNAVTVEQAFASCGLYPWDPSRVLDDDRKVTPSDLVPPPPEKPSITMQISGRWVKSEIIAHHINEKARITAEKELDKQAKLEARDASKKKKEKEKIDKAAAREAMKATKAIQKLKSSIKKSAKQVMNSQGQKVQSKTSSQLPRGGTTLARSVRIRKPKIQA